MDFLRVSEVYTSVQGEGDFVGIPTVFVRFAGCNMRCPGWPCDTPHAIDPKIWHKEAEKLIPGELFYQISALGINNICFTGGEPFMQDNQKLKELYIALAIDDFKVECFSNGSYLYPDWVLGSIHIMMDWKLEGSGEQDTKRDIRFRNAKRLHPSDGIKFVVKDGNDLDEARDLTFEFKQAGIDATLWVGAAWGTVSDADIVAYMLEYGLPWRLNVQLHKYIWPADKRGV